MAYRGQRCAEPLRLFVGKVDVASRCRLNMTKLANISVAMMLRG